MDRLGDQHPAAILGEAAASGLVIIALLRPPPGHDQMHRVQGAQLALRKLLRERHGGGAEAVLEDDAQRHPGIVAGCHDPFGGRSGALHRLFHQHMLAGPCRRGDDLLARIGRGQHQDGVDRRIGQHCLIARDGRECIFGAELVELGAVAPPDAAHRDRVPKGIQGQGMRLCRHPRTHHAQPEPAMFIRHSAASF
ncbi:hypothetical protein D3C87_1376060 [compost metagenome]